MHVIRNYKMDIFFWKFKFIGLHIGEIGLKTCIFEEVSVSDRSGQMGDRSDQRIDLVMA